MSLRVIALMMLCLSATSLSRADDAALERFWREYPAASQTIQAKLKQVKGIGQQTIQVRNPDPTATPKKKFSTRQLGFSFEVDHQFQKYSVYSDSRPAKDRRKLVYCYGTDQGFMLKQVKNSDEFSIAKQGAGSRDRGYFSHLFGKYLDLPFSHFGEVSLIDWVKGPVGELVSAELVVRDGKEYMKLHASWRSQKASTVDIELDIDKGWVIRSVATHTIDHGDIALIADYPDDRRGWPLPSTIRCRQPDGANDVCTFTKVAFEPTPLEEFSIEHYIPDAKPLDQGKRDARTASPTAATRDEMSKTIIGLVVAALLLGVVAYGIRRASRSNSAGQSP